MTDTNQYDEVLQLFIQDIKDSPDPLHRQIAVQNYKIYCEAELNRLTAIGYSKGL